MRLEPTEEQLRVLERKLSCHPASVECCATYEEAAREVFALVRDIVLEEAAKRCENLPGRLSLDGPLVAAGCARAIRAMMGTP